MAFGKNEGALELPRRDTSMEIEARFVVRLPPANDQLVFLDGKHRAARA